ncbi:flagellar basal body P-ring formation chaperone FlgA [Paraburkholderia rhizosphaerae]|uniref:Flagella basal body P-ring formation protein FlgA n=1 Tax=Paraburkholderia rhizosphaerae TaxID=480658 RepID=A0A4R8LW96_9BURK|nr:flagellar basal body P-ring formation chaperone FlgA [Paraburkholderia rhizosphaerae]TDY51888.1 flagella basal body P-ring formation protein FlgA [Paraburkholderia rhizosphaerae]
MALPAFAALPGVCRAARLRGAARQALRASSVAARLTIALPGIALTLTAVAPITAFAQDNGGPIVIPGPGEKNPADAQAMVARMGVTTRASQPSAAALAALRPTPAAQRAADADDGQIVIPGTAEAGNLTGTGRYPANATHALNAANAPTGTVTSGVVTISNAPPGIPVTMQRVNMPPAANRVAPVTVSNAQARYSPPASDIRAADASNASDTIEIDPLSARGMPPQLGGSGGTAAVKTPVAATAEQVNAAGVAARPAAAQTAQPAVAQAAAQTAQRPAQSAQIAQLQATRAAQRTVATGNAVPVAATGAVAAVSNAADAVAAAAAGQQDPESIRATALAFLQQQTAGLPGKITITVAPGFRRGLAACTALEPFMPVGARLWGRTSVGVRCAGARPWTIYLQARISLLATYYTAARQIAPGETLSAADLVAHDGDLAVLPQTVITDPSQAVGAVALQRIGPGMPLRQDTLRSAASVTAGQTVRVVAAGDGFTISAEGNAMSNAAPGQQVRVKTTNGQIVTGVVKDGATVEIQM